MLLKLPTKPAESPEPHSHRRKLSIAHSVVPSNLDLYLGPLQGNAMGLLDSRSHHPVRRYSGCQSERKARPPTAALCPSSDPPTPTPLPSTNTHPETKAHDSFHSVSSAKPVAFHRFPFFKPGRGISRFMRSHHDAAPQKKMLTGTLTRDEP
ncbi:unnamed protein product [Arctogadus glacialis]